MYRVCCPRGVINDDNNCSVIALVVIEGTAPSVTQPLENVVGRASEQTVLTCKINRGKPEAELKWSDLFLYCICRSYPFTI